MCLVISVLLGALGVNFYLNGFYLPALISGVAAMALLVLMIRNASCRKNGCKTIIKKEDNSDN